MDELENEDEVYEEICDFAGYINHMAEINGVSMGEELSNEGFTPQYPDHGGY